MKLELILFFVVACMAQEEDFYPLTEYPLLQDSFADMATLRYLDAYLVSRGNAVVKCYTTHQGRINHVAKIFKSNLTKVEKSISNTVIRTHRKNAEYLINLLKEICDKLISCQNAVWSTMENGTFVKAAEIIWDFRKEISKSVNRYESHLSTILDEKSRVNFKKSIDDIIAEIEVKYKEVNDSFEKCVRDTT